MPPSAEGSLSPEVNAHRRTTFQKRRREQPRPARWPAPACEQEPQAPRGRTPAWLGAGSDLPWPAVAGHFSVGWRIGRVGTGCFGPPLLLLDPRPLFSRSTPLQLLVRPPRKAASCSCKCQDFAIALFTVTGIHAADGDL